MSHLGGLTSSFTQRFGYQGEYAEQDPETRLAAFEARMYDAVTGRWLAVDPQHQFHSPYLAMGNNPVMMVDPDGEFVFTALALIAAPFTGGATLALLPYTIGADIGAWSGGAMANGTMNPLKWDYGSNKTWSYMAAGAAVGAVSAGAATAVATSGMAFANTAAIITGSLLNSLGTAIYTDGQTDLTVAFGFGSYNFSTGEFGYLGKKGNSALENVGYGLGAFANLTDAWALAKGAHNSNSSLELQTDGHSQTFNPESGETFSWGAMTPDGDYYQSQMSKGQLIFKKLNAVKNYENSTGKTWMYRTSNISKVNIAKYNQYHQNLGSDKFYRFASLAPIKGMHCTTAASRALLSGGVFNIPILRMPWFLDMQMRLRNVAYLSYTLH